MISLAFAFKLTIFVIFAGLSSSEKGQKIGIQSPQKTEKNRNFVPNIEKIEIFSDVFSEIKILHESNSTPDSE